MLDNDLIELLNDVNHKVLDTHSTPKSKKRENPDIFLDANGRPTDR